MRGPSRTVAVLAFALAAASIAITAPAGAAARVGVANQFGAAAIDPTYTTKLDLSGSGFQSIRKGHGGIYVLFGAIKGEWRPSKGGKTGQNYLTVPDSESKSNGGFARFVAFPGSDTAGSANGGTIAANGTWRTSINVPGATFQAVDRNGKVQSVDCRRDTCGVLTVGAHGVVNGNNESFTRVSVKDLYTGGAEPPSNATTGTGTATTGSTAPQSGTGAPAAAPPGRLPVAAGPPTLDVDRASARPGRALAFSASGLAPGSQVSATFEDGLAAVGPLNVAANGQLAGVLKLPADLSAGTYELRLTGAEDLPSVRFAVTGNPVVADEDSDWLPAAFAGLGGLVLVGALVAAFLIRRQRAVRA